MLTNTQIAQLCFLFCTSGLFATAFVLGLRHLRVAGMSAGASPSAQEMQARPLAPAARYLTASGSILAIALLVWRTFSEGRLSLPPSNYFDAFLVLALLLALVLGYFRLTRHLRALALFLLPMIAMLLLLGGALSLARPTTYTYGSLWTSLHVATIVAGTFCFALGCVGGVVYLLAHGQLKHKGNAASHRWMGLPPLASIEKFNQTMIYLGFPLLTIAMISGAFRLAQEPDTLRSMAMQSKVMLSLLAWAVYGILVLLPLSPQFRGPRAAWLWIIGFTLFIGGFVAANWVR